MQDPTERLTALEIALTHQEAMVEDLSDIIRRHADEIAVLRRDVAWLGERLEELRAGGGEVPPSDVRPPHW